MERIVVGVDGSDESLVALDWALSEAKVRGAALEVVHTYMPNLSEAAVGTEPSPREAEELLRKMVEPTAGAYPGVPVTALAVEGPSARTLLDTAAGATLLVVGSRGRGGFAGLMLGSVSQQVVHHATCPVVIVPNATPRA